MQLKNDNSIKNQNLRNKFELKISVCKQLLKCMILMLLIWDWENQDKSNLIFGEIRYVKGTCATSYYMCPPDPDCYPFVAPTSKCLELQSGVQQTYFGETNTYISHTYDWMTSSSLNYGYMSLSCQIHSASEGCVSFGLSSSAGAILSLPTISNSPLQTCDITIGCQLHWYYNGYNGQYCSNIPMIISPTITLKNTYSTCTQFSCSSESYAKTASSSDTSFLAYQYAGTSNQYTFGLESLSRYFNIQASCNFEYCALVSAIGTKTSQGTIQSLVATQLLAAGATTYVYLKIDTSALILSVPLHLSCAVSATTTTSSCLSCESIQFFVYSVSPITFSVSPGNQCYSPKAHAALSYIQGTSTTIAVLATDFIAQSDPRQCTLTDCQIIDSLLLAVPSYLTLVLTSGLSYNINLNLAITQSASLIFKCTGIGGVAQQSSSFSLTITCSASVCASGSYSRTGTSAPSTFIAYQYFGYQNSLGQYLFNQSSVLLSQYFNYPIATCSFSSCSLLSAVGSNTQQGTLNTQFTASISGTGSSQSVIFQMDTANTFSGALYLSCTVPSAAESVSNCAINQFFVYSSNPITFAVQSCYTPQTPANIVLYQNQGNGFVTLSIDSSTIMALTDPSCPLTCTITTLPTQLTLTSSSTTLYQIVANTNSAVVPTSLFYTCQGTGAQVQSKPFNFEITACIPSVCESGYTFSGTSNPSTYSVYQYNGTSNVQASVLISQYCTMPSTSCTFTSCSLVSVVGNSASEGTLSSMVTSTYSSSTNMIQFTVDPSIVQSQNLYLSCLVPSAAYSGTTCALTQFYVFSYNQISFNVVSCYVPQTPASYSYLRYYSGGTVNLQIQVSSFMTLLDATCPLSNCVLVDSRGATPQSMTLTYVSSSLYQLNLDTSLAVIQQTQYFQCQVFLGNIFKSNPFTYQVGYSCNSTSTTIKAPSNIRNIYYIVNEPGTLTSLKISNFTSINPDCHVIQHKLVVSQSSISAPTYVKIQEGNSSFTISNSSMAWLANIYTFYIYAQALGGAVLYQPITIQILNDCSLDLIYINPIFPSNQEQMVSSYITVNSLPVLILNTTSQKPISVDISKRIKNIFTSSCTLLQYKISKALINSSIVDISTFENYFTLSLNGVFQTLSSSPTTIFNSQVYIQANNKQIWGGDQQQYLIDVTIIVDQSISNTDNLNNSNNIQANSSASSQADLSQNGNQSQTQSQSSQSGSKSQNNKQQGTSNLNKQLNKKFDIYNFRRHQKTQNKIDQQEIHVNKTKIIKPLPVYFSQITIDKKGMMQITFNQELQVPDFAQLYMQLKQNQSFIYRNKQNQSIELQYNQQIAQQNLSMKDSYQNIVSLQSILAFQISVNSLQDQSLLNFKIQLQDWTSKGLSILLSFKNPTLVSSGSEYDIINMQVLNGSNFTSANGLVPMDEYINGFNQTKIQPQQPTFISVQMVQTIESNSQSLTIAIIVIQVVSQVFMKANLELLHKLFLNMQMQQSLPIYQINFPYKSQLYIDTDRSIVEFEFLKPQKLIERTGLNLSLVTVDNNTPSNAKRLGMSSTSMLDNMMTYIFIFGIFVLLLILISILYVFPCVRQKIIDFVKDKIKQFKWNGILRAITISYLKLSSGLSIQIQSERNNIQNLDVKTYIQQIAMLIFLIGYIIFSQIKISLNQKDFKNIIFQQEYGFLVESQKIERINIRNYEKFSNTNVIFIYPSFLLYRLIYSMIPCIFYNQPGIQVQILLLLTLFYIYIQAKMKTQLSLSEYYIDMYSEFMLLMMQMHMFWFMDGGILNGTPHEVSQDNYLWFQSVADSSFMACGMSIIAVGISQFGKYITQQLINLYKKKKNQSNHLENLKKPQINDKDYYNNIYLKNREEKFKKVITKLKEKKAEKKVLQIDTIQFQNQQEIIMNQQLPENVIEKEIKQEMNQNRKLFSQQISESINDQLPLINAITKLKNIVRNPKVMNKISLMSEIEDNKSLDDQSIDEEDIDQIEHQNLQAVCQKYEYIFNTWQYRQSVNINMITKKELVLRKYSILSTDSKSDIDIKTKMLLFDVLSNDHLLKKLDKPLQTFQMFESDVRQYYENKIDQKSDS